MQERKPSEAELIKQLTAKDKKAYELLYNSYSAALYGILLRIVMSEDEASDLLQEVFVKIWQGIDGYDPNKGSLFTWMLNICRNAAIDRRRSKNFKNNQKNLQADNIVLLVGNEHSTSIPIDHIGLKDVVNKLDDDYKTLINAVYFEGYTQKEVSERLQMPLGTVKTRLRTAIQKLRTLI
jgi:RNA polymerase sigma-70 factor (ECF subfamily)